ncbi:Ig-like domain (group 4) [Clostridium cavendishii DSM 21758]|uniref:Ig-like domain (Group 4) n=1 Tax=Clostridium cavendishii DSM 21758 TaxID=1121302 RepID=A0A1M6R8E1_9CLOT|nr:Ig-like domain-containing protein [Clostridium cavendishii]SHK28696.1 Ig-like domain (group 4) [Clostridium cavendishii DSM 21758]
MKRLLNDIKSKFEPIKLNISVYQNSNYNSPTKVNAKINNEDKEVNVVWNNDIDTSKLEDVK